MYIYIYIQFSSIKQMVLTSFICLPTAISAICFIGRKYLTADLGDKAP